MKKIKHITLAILACMKINAQNIIADSYKNVKGWTGHVKITVVENPEPESNYKITAEGTATLMNTNPKVYFPFVWPQVSTDMNIDLSSPSPDPNSSTFMQDLENLVNVNKSLSDANLQWDATINFIYKSKKTPMDIHDIPHDITCTYQGRKKSLLSITIFADEKNQCWFVINGAASITGNKDPISCSGTMNNEVMNKEQGVLTAKNTNGSANGTARKKITTAVYNFQDTITYKEEGKTITISYNMTAIR